MGVLKIWDGSAWVQINAADYTHPNHTGDVTSSGDGATTIADEAVTYAKMQHVSAASRLLGRGSAAGDGDVEEITLGSGLTMSGTELAASGEANVFPKGFITGLRVTNSGADPDHDIDISTGECRNYDDDTDMTLSSAITNKQCDAAWAVGVSAGALLSGTLDASSVYGVWLIRRSDTGVVDVGVEKNKVNPNDTITLPTNYDADRLIWVFFTDASSNIIPWIYHPGAICIYSDAPIEDVNDATITDGTAETGTVSVPPNCLGWVVGYFYNESNAYVYGSVTHPDASAQDDDAEASHILFTVGPTQALIATKNWETVDGSRQLEYRATEPSGTTRVKLLTYGWQLSTRLYPYDV